MTHQRVPPPREQACLSRPYPSSQKGGTLIAEAVKEMRAHLRLLADPDSYRPACCPGCGHGRLHLHDYRTRLCHEPGAGELRIARYRCAGCGGRWQVLPAFVPRRLWFHWPQVEVGCGRERPRPHRERGREPSERTAQRWWARLMSAALMITQVLASSAEATLVGVAQRVGLLATRVELVDAIDRSLSEVAGLIHRLVPGVRLM